MMGQPARSSLEETECTTSTPQSRGQRGTMTPRAQVPKGSSRLVWLPYSETGVAPGGNPRPQYAFKVSMFNVSCNSH